MDKERVLAKVDELNSYLDELNSIKPDSFEEYENSIEKKRACERLLQISIEVAIDICYVIVTDLKLGLPSDEEDVFKKLLSKKIISKEMKEILTNMKGFRNILVHKYGIVKDDLVFEMLSERLEDFEKFKEEILKFTSKI